MTIRHLEVFKAVCDQQSMVKAAKQLYMSQPAVSQAIKELETTYQVTLFDRMNRQLYLTDAGKTLYDYASSLLETYQESIDVLQHQHYQFHIKIGFNVTYGQCKGADLLTSLQHQFPNVTFEVIVDNASHIEDMLLNHQLDLAILDEFIHPELLEIHPVSQLEMKAVMKKQDYHMTTLQEVSQSPLLLREHGSAHRRIVDHAFQSAGLPLQPFLTSTSDLALLSFAKAGLGIAFMDPFLVDDELMILDLEDASFIRHFYLAYATKRSLPKMLQDIITFLTHL